MDAVHPGISTGALFLPVGPGPTLYHEISSHKEISSQQLYNYTTVQHFTTIYPFLRHVLFTFSFTNVTLPKYVSIRQDQDEQIDIIVTDMIEMVARNRQRNIKFTC